MTGLILFACVAACPLVMGTMMLMMMRRRHSAREETRGDH